MKKFIVAMLIVGIIIIGFPKVSAAETVKPAPFSQSEIASLTTAGTNVDIEAGGDSGDVALTIVVVLLVLGCVGTVVVVN